MRRRLLAMAYFLKLRSQEEEARMAQAAAQDLAAGSRGSLAGENPFLQTLVWEALKLARGFLEQTQKEGESPSPILAPSTDPLLIRR